MGNKIALDGPSGTGKSTVAKLLSEKLSYLYVDTGAMFRALGVYVISGGIDPYDEDAVTASLPDVSLSVEHMDDGQHVFVNGDDITGRLRTQKISDAASVISRYKAVRDKVLAVERELGDSHDVIMDGRDIGTVIFPDAFLKIFMTADPKVRALRRYNQLKELGTYNGETLSEIEAEIRERDDRDAKREVAPCVMAEDAVLIDTSAMTLQDVIERIAELYHERMEK